MSLTAIITISVIIVILVLVMTIFQVNKSYAYKHTIDELPNNHEDDNEKKDIT